MKSLVQKDTSNSSSASWCIFGPNLYLPPSMTPRRHSPNSHPLPFALHGHLLPGGAGLLPLLYPEGQPLLSTLLRDPLDIPLIQLLEQWPLSPSSNYICTSLASDWIGTTYYLH